MKYDNDSSIGAAITVLNSSSKKTDTPYIILMWFGVFVPGHLASFMVEQLYVAILVGVTTFLLIYCPNDNKAFGISQEKIITFFALLELLYIVSYLRSEVLMFSGQGGYRDYIEVARYLIYMVIVMLVGSFHPQTKASLLYNLIRATMAFSLFVALLYIYKVPVLSGFFEDILYASTRDDLSQISSGGRVRFAAPFPNANYLAYFLCMSLVYLLFFVRGFLRLFWVFVCLILLFLTGSRTGWISSVIVIFSWQIMSLLRLFSGGGRNVLGFILMLLLTGVIGAVFVTGSVPTVTRATEILSAIASGDLNSVASYSHRLEHNSLIWSVTKESLFWGIGPSKYSLSTVIDNQYLLWLTRQGIVGLSLIMFGALYTVRRMISAADSWADLWGIFVFYLIVFLFGLTGAFLNNFRLFIMTFLFSAAVYQACLLSRRGRRTHKEFNADA